MTKHETWWSTEGSAMRPKPDEDIEEFAKRITQIAWSNGEYVEREACAKLVEVPDNYEDWEIMGGSDGRELLNGIAAEIRARGEA